MGLMACFVYTLSEACDGICWKPKQVTDALSSFSVVINKFLFANTRSGIINGYTLVLIKTGPVYKLFSCFSF